MDDPLNGFGATPVAPHPCAVDPDDLRPTVTQGSRIGESVGHLRASPSTSCFRSYGPACSGVPQVPSGSAQLSAAGSDSLEET